MLNEDPSVVKKVLNKSKSLYDQSRDTVGKIYVDAQKSGEDCIEIGDMSRELTKCLIEDINKALRQFDKKEKPYFLMVHEKKDLQMKQAILRRMLYFGYRPYPEDDTIVFRRDPIRHTLHHCWTLPHWSEMDNILNNATDYPVAYINQIRAWKANDLVPFGFYHHATLKWIPDPTWQDELIPRSN